MKRHHLATTVALVCIATAAPTMAEELSTSVMRPSPISASTATVSGKLPGAASRTYYLAADLSAGSLLTQLQISGRANGSRALTLQLLKPDASVAETTFVRSGFGTSDERTKSFAIDSAGRYVIRLVLEGDETGNFCVLFGGTALPNAKAQSCSAASAAAAPAPMVAPPAAAAAAAPMARPSAAAPAVAPLQRSAEAAAAPPATSSGELSTSVLRPSALDRASGVVAGKLPGGDTVKSYYLATDLNSGNLLAQLQVAGRANANRRLTLQLLDTQAAVLDQAFVRSGFGTSDETTKVFPIDRSGSHLLRLIVEGEELGTYCVLFGGTALVPTAPQSCPAAPAAPLTSAQIQAPPAPKPIEIVVGQCEERLRVGADFLFDFNRAELRAEATPALDALVQRIAATDEPVMVEGHTDAIGTEGYNLGLSERRAASVRNSLIGRGLRDTQLVVRGHGKTRPIAPNQRPDGSDDPDGRQQNRRVEVVIHTCE
jgi:outer membrane protein OmpA-like peptidoglycan-associated protein